MKQPRIKTEYFLSLKPAMRAAVTKAKSLSGVKLCTVKDLKCWLKNMDQDQKLTTKFTVQILRDEIVKLEDQSAVI